MLFYNIRTCVIFVPYKKKVVSINIVVGRVMLDRSSLAKFRSAGPSHKVIPFMVSTNHGKYK